MSAPHPNDDAYLADIIARCRALRRRHNLDLADVAAVCGTTAGAVSDFETNAGNRKLGSIQQHAHGAGYRTVFAIAGLYDIEVPEAVALLAAGARSTDWRRRHEFERAALGALLKAHREHVGLTQRDLASRLGNHKTNVALVEKLTHDPLIRTVQTHIRALGGVLRVRFVLADAAAVSARIRELADELADYGLGAPRWKVTTAAGAMKGIPGPDAWRIAEWHGGVVHRSTVHVLPTGHELLGPWVEIPPIPATN